MTPVAAAHRSPQRDMFVKWQCRVRQFAMRQRQGRPDEAVRPEVAIPGQTRPIGSIITVLNRAPENSMTPELDHIAARTHDLAERHEQAVRFLSAGYYQTHRQFTDTLTATFPPNSVFAFRILEAGLCLLRFDAYGQRFDLSCRARRLAEGDPLFLATLAHNRLFNPELQPNVEVLGFEPNWSLSSSEPKAA